MPDIIITYRETYDYLMKEYLEIYDFRMTRKLKIKQFAINKLYASMGDKFRMLDELLNAENKDIIKIETLLMNLHESLSTIYQLRIESMEGAD